MLRPCNPIFPIPLPLSEISLFLMEQDSFTARTGQKKLETCRKVFNRVILQEAVFFPSPPRS